MTINGLQCLLFNILDEQPEIKDKNIDKIEVICPKIYSYLYITFEDDTVLKYKLYEKKK